MPLRDLLLRRRGVPPETVTQSGTEAPALDPVRLQESCFALQRLLAVAEQRITLIDGSNRTAARGLRTLRQERDTLLQEREFLTRQRDLLAQERERLIALREAAEIGFSVAVSDKQRTMVLNDHLLSELRRSEDERARLEAENRRLRASDVSSG